MSIFPLNPFSWYLQMKMVHVSISFWKKVNLNPMFIFVHLKLFSFLSSLRIFFKGHGEFSWKCAGDSNFNSQEWTNIPFCHKIPCNTYHVMLHVASHTLSMPVFAGQNNAEVEETNQDVAQQICKPQCNF